MKIGRNDFCHCGSGLKFKHCCLDRQESGENASSTSVVGNELKELIKGQNFASLDEANAFLRQQMQQRNQRPLDDFHGLSPKQMHRFLNFPFDSPELITFFSGLDTPPEAPIMSLFSLLIDTIGEQGLKATATGNLPRNFCRESARAYRGEEEYQRWAQYGELRSELEFREMHVTRLVAELAGLIRKYKGKFILSRQCREIMAQNGLASIYRNLFQTFVRKFNWAYLDNFEEISFIQQSFLFSLYQLTLYGDDWQTNIFYETNFLQAFPDLLHQVKPIGSYYSPEEEIRNSYSRRCLEGFARFFGLVETERCSKDRYSQGFRVRKLPLLNHAVRFQLTQL